MYTNTVFKKKQQGFEIQSCSHPPRPPLTGELQYERTAKNGEGDKKAARKHDIRMDGMQAILFKKYTSHTISRQSAFNVKF